MEYDEDTVLTDYVLFNYALLISPAEFLGHKASTSGKQESGYERAFLQEKAVYEEKFGRENWNQMVKACAKGPEAFQRRVRDRLLEDHASSLRLHDVLLVNV